MNLFETSPSILIELLKGDDFLKRSFFVLGSLIALMGVTLFTVNAATPKLGIVPNVILISWDGVQREHLRELLAAKKLPNLANLSREGGIVEIDVTHNTATKAGHSQMLSGYGPEWTGVHNNNYYQPIPVGMTIFERLEDKLGSDKIMTVMITGKSGHVGALGPKPLNKKLKVKLEKVKKQLNNFDKKVDKSEADQGEKKTSNQEQQNLAVAKLVQQLTQFVGPVSGQPFYNAVKKIDLVQVNKQREADEVGALTEDALNQVSKNKDQRFFAFFHFSDPDHQGHKFGENSNEYSTAIIKCDQWLGKLVADLKAKGLSANTRIYVTSDHGFDEGLKSHKNAPYVFLATNDTAIQRRGDQRDLVPTILARMGVDPWQFTPRYAGRLLTEPERKW